MYYPSSENKGADQLRGYREADLRLCFRLCRLLVFPRGGSFVTTAQRNSQVMFTFVQQAPTKTHVLQGFSVGKYKVIPCTCIL